MFGIQFFLWAVFVGLHVDLASAARIRVAVDEAGLATAPQIRETGVVPRPRETAEARSHEALLEQADLKVENDRPGHVNKTFAWHEKQGRDESGDVPVIVQKEEEETEG